MRNPVLGAKAEMTVNKVHVNRLARTAIANIATGA